jgi:hypothetical protein
MNNLLENLLNPFYKAKRAIKHSDPSIGLEYNKIQMNYRVSRYKYRLDIARSPKVYSSSKGLIDVNASATEINSHRALIEYKKNRVKGRTA